MTDIKINIDNPKVDFDISSQTMASFQFFELEQTIDDAMKAEQADKSIDPVIRIRDWMITKGLPETVNVVTVDKWLNAYMLAMAEEQKKASGQ